MERHDRAADWSHLAGCGELSGQSYRPSVEPGGNQSRCLPWDWSLHARRSVLRALQHASEFEPAARALVVGAESGRGTTDREPRPPYQPRHTGLSGTEAVVSASCRGWREPQWELHRVALLRRPRPSDQRPFAWQPLYEPR